MNRKEQDFLSKRADNEGRRLAEKALKDYYPVTDFKDTDIKEHYDATFSLYGRDYALELKYRKGYSRNSPVIKNEGGILEKYKVDQMNKDVPDGYRKVYMLIWNDGSADIWNIDNIDNLNTQHKEDLPNVTVNPDAGRAGKDIYLLPLDEGECRRRGVKHKTIRYDN